MEEEGVRVDMLVGGVLLWWWWGRPTWFGRAERYSRMNASLMGVVVVVGGGVWMVFSWVSDRRVDVFDD